MNDEKRAHDDASSGNAEPYRTPKDVTGDISANGLLKSKRLWLALLAVVLFAGGGFAMLATRAVMGFGGMNRGRPVNLQQSVENFGEDRGGDVRYHVESDLQQNEGSPEQIDPSDIDPSDGVAGAAE